MIRNKSKLMKLGLPDKSLRTLSLNMTVPISMLIETIAEKVQLPKLIWNEYSLCVNFDKESKQLEMAIKFIQNAKSLASLKKMVTSSNGDFLSKVRGHIKKHNRIECTKQPLLIVLLLPFVSRC